MIDYIHVQLTLWAAAQRQDARKGLGYASVCPMFRDVKHGGVYGSAPPVGVMTITAKENVADTAAAVARLDAPARQLVAEYYLVGGTGDEIAARLGLARRTLYDRLHMLHQALLGLIQDVIAGVGAPPEKSVDTRRTQSV